MATIDNKFGAGIGVANGFDLGAQKPLDSRIAVNTIAERDAHVTENRAYEGMMVYVAETGKNYQLKEVVEEVEGEVVKKLEWVDTESDLQGQLDEIKEAMGLDGTESEDEPSILDRIKAEEDALGLVDGKLPDTGIEVKDAGGNVVTDPTVAQQLAQVQDNVEAEAARVDAIIGTLPTVGEGEEAKALTVAEAIEAEADRAEAAEKALQDVVGLDAEGKIGETGLGGETVKAQLTDAGTRVKALEDDLAKQKDATQEGTLAKKIADEAARAAQAEQDLADDIQELADSVSTTVNDVIGDLTGTGLQGAEGNNNTVAEQLTQAHTDIVAEAGRAAGEEAAIRREMATEAARVDKKIADDIATEAARIDAVVGDLADTGLEGATVTAKLKDAANKIGALDSEVEKELGKFSVAGDPQTGEGAVVATGLRKEIEDRDAAVLAEAKKHATDSIAKITVNAPEAFDTLKEIADWIANSEDQVKKDAETLVTTVDRLDGAVEVEGSVKQQIAAAKSALQKEIDDDVKVVADELAKQIADEVTRAKAEEADIRADFAAELGNYTVAEAEGVQAKEASGLRKEIEDAHNAMDQALASAKAGLIGDAAEDYNTLGKLEDAIQAHEATVNAVVGSVATGVEDATEGADNSLKALIQRAVAKAAKETSDLQSDMASTVASLKAEIKDGELALNLVEGKGESQVVTPIAKTTVPTMTDEEEAAAIAAIIAPPVQEPEQPAE